MASHNHGGSPWKTSGSHLQSVEGERWAAYERGREASLSLMTYYFSQLLHIYISVPTLYIYNLQNSTIDFSDDCNQFKGHHINMTPFRLQLTDTYKTCLASLSSRSYEGRNRSTLENQPLIPVDSNAIL